MARDELGREWSSTVPFLEVTDGRRDTQHVPRLDQKSRAAGVGDCSGEQG